MSVRKAAVRNTVLLLAVLATQASAGTARCGTDDFGNAVCMDSAGAVTAAPPDWQAGSGVPAAGPAGQSGSEGGGRRVRCGVDPFGNKVCR